MHCIHPQFLEVLYVRVWVRAGHLDFWALLMCVCVCVHAHTPAVYQLKGQRWGSAVQPWLLLPNAAPAAQQPAALPVPLSLSLSLSSQPTRAPPRWDGARTAGEPQFSYPPPAPLGEATEALCWSVFVHWFRRSFRWHLYSSLSHVFAKSIKVWFATASRIEILHSIAAPVHRHARVQLSAVNFGW